MNDPLGRLHVMPRSFAPSPHSTRPSFLGAEVAPSLVAIIGLLNGQPRPVTAAGATQPKSCTPDAAAFDVLQGKDGNGSL